MIPTTMKRIAADLGVSITTVSKVLNHHADIGEATRARVLAHVETELGRADVTHVYLNGAEVLRKDLAQ